jgi:hypothetical protein
MNHFDNYLAEFEEDDLRLRSFRKTAEDFTNGEIENFDHKSRINGLLYGEVQSGKTSHTFAAIAATADVDPGFNTFVYLSTDNVPLQEQTYSRAIAALSTFSVCTESDEIRFNNTRPNVPVLVVLKKNSRVLSNWLATLRASDRVARSPIFIIDDEGDAASLNTKVNKDEEGTIYRLIGEMRELGTSSIYLQVTATPQALFLQAEEENLKPQFAKYFEPGEGYLGGDHFYSDMERPSNHYLDDDDLEKALKGEWLSPGMRQFVAVYLATCAHLRISKGQTNVNALVHPAVGTGVHKELQLKLQRYLDHLTQPENLMEARAELLSGYNDLKKSVKNLVDFESIFSMAVSLKPNCVVMNYKEKLESNDSLKAGLNVVVGANTLGRGVTFPNLQTVYYARKAKVPQFDTAWQHSRIFGYDRDADSVRLFMPVVLFKLFHALQEANSLLRDAIKSGNLNAFQIVMAKGSARPTRSNVYRASVYSLLVGGVNYFPIEPNQSNLGDLDHILAAHTEREILTIDIDVAKTLVKKAAETNSGWPVPSFLRALKDMAEGDHKIPIWLMVARDRDLGYNTGTMLSENDRNTSKAKPYCDGFVLTAYRILGSREKGWQGKPFWMVNLRMPDNYVYHSVLDSSLAS